MKLWFALLAITLVVPVTMTFGGWLVMKKPPKRINSTYGYRTERSMKNEDTWRFAHRFFGALWWKWGRISLILTVAIWLPFLGQSEDVLGAVSAVVMALSMIPLLGAIPPTEKALKKTFDENGQRKENAI